MDSLSPVETYLESTRKPQRAQTHHRPSSARIEVEKGEVYGQCLRAQFYSWKNEPETNPPDLSGLFNFYMGHIIEDMYEEGLKLEKKNYTREYPFQVDIGLKNILSARMDFIMHEEGKDYGVELKTGYGQGISRTKAKGLPKENYILQMMLYYKYCPLNPYKIENPTYARDSFYRLPFVLIGRDDGTFTIGSHKGFRDIPWTCDMLLESWVKLEDYLKTDTLPPKDYQGTWNCNYCAYRDKCKGEVK